MVKKVVPDYQKRSEKDLMTRLNERLARQAELQQECDDLRRRIQVDAGQLRSLRDELAEAREIFDLNEGITGGLADELLQL